MNHSDSTLTEIFAVTDNHEFISHFAKHRAVEAPFQHDVSDINLNPHLVIQFNDNRKTSNAPTKLPSARAEVYPSRTGSNSPKCPEKPCFIPLNTSFLASESNYEKLKENVEKGLGMLEEYDWSYFENDCMWKCKYFQGSGLRELHVYCYWDSNNEDHIIEVKRVRGDGFNPSSSVDFFSKLKSVVTNSEEELSHSKKGGNLRGPLPLPTLRAAGAPTAPALLPMLPLRSLPTNSAMGPPTDLPRLPLLKLSRGGSVSIALPLPTLCAGIKPAEVTEEQFLSGIKPIYSMSTDQCYEPRVEAAKMLCDLATKEKRFLELKDCHELCVKSLDALLLDEFDEVKQFAVMAFASFADLSIYKKSFLGLRGLESLVHLINNNPRGVSAYHTAQMRRKAAMGLSLVAGSFPREVCELLKRMGYQTEQSWLDHCLTILDKKTREYAMTLGKCFC